jgi:hypothetical protein
MEAYMLTGEWKATSTHAVYGCSKGTEETRFFSSKKAAMSFIEEHYLSVDLITFSLIAGHIGRTADGLIVFTGLDTTAKVITAL